VLSHLLDGLFAEARPASGAAPAASPPRTLEAAASELAQILQSARQGPSSGEASPATSSLVSDRREEELRARWRQEREEARRQMEADILSLHQRLGTGIDAAEIARLQRLLRAHLPPPPTSPTLQERIERHVLERLYTEVGRIAWRRLGDLMAAAGVEWPVPEGLARGRSPEELAPVMEQHLLDLEEQFVSMPPAALADLMAGEVSIWKYCYPEAGSALWRETALRAVAAALRAQFFAAAIEWWIWRPHELEEKLLAILEGELERSRQLLRGGLAAPGAGSELLGELDEVCRSTLPSLVWQFVRDNVEWDDTGVLPALARGLTWTDPVCGMRLTSDRAIERASWQGQTYYFCQPACREKFCANPASFLEAAPKSQAGR
jgi:YHS domain-containing protein